MNVEQIYSDFVVTLHSLVTDLHTYRPTEETETILDIFKKIKMNTVIMRYFEMMNKHSEALKNKDPTIFKKNLYILPDINLKEYWEELNLEMQERLWTYLNTLFILSEMMITVSQMKDNFYASNANNNEQKDFSVDSMFDGQNFVVSKPGNISEMMKLMGIDKMIDIDELTNSLRNMKQSDIDEATKNIMQMIGVGDGDNKNEKMTKMIGNMLESISGELQSMDFSQGNPIDSIIKIAESVAESMKPKVESGEIDINDIMASATSLTGGAGNPMEILAKMMGNINLDQQQQQQIEQTHTQLTDMVALKRCEKKKK